ncbi:MAG: SDR family oxidoreductase [Lachnospiraceae bacterium]|jgi:dTDP-4-dehydrorhamnose reductase|nr:SDR family oxidoreductase [Lachnospiraceae bacterium]
MKFLVLGCNGMAGHMVSLYLKEQGYEVTGFAKNKSQLVETVTGDARDLELVRDIIEAGQYDTVINCIGLLNKFAENDHEAAVFLNSFFPQYLAKVTQESVTQIIHISTDCVFSGSTGGYKENDFPDGTLFYDRSKALGELIDQKNVTFRNSIIGPDLKKEGIGLVNWFMQQEGRVRGYKNAIWTGQTTLQLAKTIENAAIQKVHGLYNMVPEERISKYDMLVLFNEKLRAKPIEIVPEENFRIDKSLVRTNYERFSYKIPGYREQIEELGIWMREHKELYSHYQL